MSLIILGKDEAEWITVRKNLIRSGNSIAGNPQFKEVQTLLSHVSNLEHPSINQLMLEVFSPLISHYLMYSQKQYKRQDKDALDQFLKESLRVTSTLEKVKSLRSTQECIEAILSPSSRYYSSKDNKITVKEDDDFVIPLTNCLDSTVVILRNDDGKENKDSKEEYWVSDSEEEVGDQLKRVKENSSYCPILFELIQLFLSEYQLDNGKAPFVFLFYLRVLRDLQVNKLIYKHHLSAIYQKLRDLLMQKLNNITQQGLKQDSLQTVLTKDSILFGLTKVNQKTFILSLTFLYQTKLMNSINVHNRLKGCSLLSDFCEELMYQHRVSEDINFYAKRLMNEKIIEKIFTLDTNEQILAKASKLFQFMVRSSCLTNQNLKQILHLGFEGNQNQRKLILECIGSVIVRFSFEQVEIINSKVLSTPLQQFTVEMIKLIYNIGKYTPVNNLEPTYNFFWNIISSYDQFQKLKIECKSPVVDGFVPLLQKRVEMKQMTIEQAIQLLTTPPSNFIMFQILTKLISAMPETRLHEKYLKLGVVKTDALKYLVENVQYQDTLIKLIKSNPYTASDHVSFLTTMIEGYRPYSQTHLGVQILTHLTNQPLMFQSLLMYYKPDLQDLFNLLITSQITNIYQFQCLKKVFVTIHKLDEDRYQNPHLLGGYDMIFNIILTSANLDVKREVAIFCVQLIYNYFNKLSSEDRMDLQEILVNNAIKSLKQAVDPKQKVGCLVYIEELLNQTEMEGVGILKSHANLIPTKYVNIIVTNQTFGYSSGSRDVCVRINSNSSLFELLEKIAFQFKTSPEEINIYFHQQIKKRQNSKTVDDLHLAGNNITARSTFRPEIGKAPLLETNLDFQRVLTSKAAIVFSEIFYRYASKGYIGKQQLSNLMRVGTDDQYDYDVNSIMAQFDLDKDQKLDYQQYMNWMVDNSKFRENQVRRILENLRYRPDLIKYGQNKLDHTKTIRYYLFTKQDIYPILFDLIASQNTQLKEAAKRLLIRLPTYRKAVDWLNDIRTDNEFILWYQLLLIEYLFEGSSEGLYELICKNVDVEGWRLKFMKEQYKKLLEIIFKLMKQEITQQEQESVYLSLKIISKLSFIPQLSAVTENTLISQESMLKLDPQQIEQILSKGYKLAATPENVEAYYGLLLHYPTFLDFDQFIFNPNIEIRRICSSYMFLHRKLYGRKTNLFQKQITSEDCSEYYDVVVKEMEDDADGYQAVYPVAERIFGETSNQSLMKSMLKIMDLSLLLFPQTLQSYPSIQQMILSKFKELPPESLPFAYNILPKTDLSILIQYMIEYLEPLRIADRLPQLNNNSNKYVGLRNLGCICYMNAMIQQLFMTKQFTQRIMSEEGKEPKGILYELKRMFNYLEKSQRLDYNPRDFCYSFDKNIKLHVQQDTEEFVNKMFDRLETDSPALVDVIETQFGGKTISVRHCPCGATVTREEKFFHLTLQVKDCHTLNESLGKFITPERIPDVYCESCKTKKQISRSTYLSQLPETLIVHLKRMTFDLETLVNIKLHNYLSFPNQIQFKPFMYNKDNDFRYSLKGVIIHTGNPDGGHYYSLIKLNSKWYKFDDSHVSEFVSDFNKECYGGDYQYGQYHVKSSKNAYILMYQKNKQVSDVTHEQLLEFPFDLEVQKDNMIFQRELKFYNKQFSLFITKIATQPIIPQPIQSNQAVPSNAPPQWSSILTFILRYVQLSTQISESTFIKLKTALVGLISLSSSQYSLEQLTLINTNKEEVYKRLAESSNQWVRKIYKVILCRLFVKGYQTNPEMVKQLIQYLFNPKLFEKIEINKVSELFQLIEELLLSSPVKPADGQLLSHLVIHLCFNSTISYLTGSHLEKQEKYKIVRIKTILLEIINLSLTSILANTLQVQDSKLSELRLPSFYKKMIQDDPKIIERLTFIASQLSHNHQRITESLLPTFLSFSPEQYSVAIPYFLSIKDDYRQRRIQMIFGVPQRYMLHANPFQFSLKTTNSLYTNIINYASFSAEYKSVLQSICESANYPNRQTTIQLQLLLNLMINDQDVFTYVIALSPPSYKYGSLMDVVEEYLRKMSEIKDRKYEILRCLYLRVQGIIQRQTRSRQNQQVEKDQRELDSVFPFDILGRTVDIQKLEPLVVESGDDVVTIEQSILKTYRMRSQPTLHQNLKFSKQVVDDKQSLLNRCFISGTQSIANTQQISEKDGEEQVDDPEQTLMVIKTISNASFKLSLASSSLNVKFLICHQSNYINFPYQLVGDLSIGVDMSRQSEFKELNGSKQVIAPERDTDYKETGEYAGESAKVGGDAEVDGIICKGCTYLNPFTQEKCQICQTDLF